MADRAALTAIFATVGAAAIDVAIANTALPAIARSVDISAATSVWVVNAYQLAMAATLLPFGAAGDAFGPRRVFLAGAGIFTLASLGCGIASSFSFLVAARVAQGVGAAAISAVTPALIRAIYPADRLARGLGLYAFTVGVGFTAGPMLASLILSVSEWPSLFLINVPVGCVAILLAYRALPGDPRLWKGFDLVSSTLCIGLFAGLLTVLEWAAHGGRMGLAPLLLPAALSCGGVLLYRQRLDPTPLLAVDLFRRPLFLLSSLTSIGAFAVQGIAFVALPFWLQVQQGVGQIRAGYLLTGWPACAAAMAVVTPYLARRWSAAWLGGGGLALLAIGTGALAASPTGLPEANILALVTLCGLGFGLFQSPNMSAILMAAPETRGGAAGGVLAVSRLVGQSVGAAAAAAAFSAAPARGAVAALWIACGGALLASGISVARTRFPK